jgi:hypothetical protein
MPDDRPLVSSPLQTHYLPSDPLGSLVTILDWFFGSDKSFESLKGCPDLVLAVPKLFEPYKDLTEFRLGLVVCNSIYICAHILPSRPVV